MDKELIDIYDIEMNLLGVADKDQVHKEGLWHKVFHCWIISEDGNVWLPLRSDKKTLNPKLLDISCAKHLMVGETAKQCGINEFEDTYSIKLKENDLIKMFTQTMFFDFPYKNCEFCPTYLYKTQHKFNDLVIDNNEFDAVFLADIQDLVDLFFDDVKSIDANGVKLSNKNELRKNITKDDFCPYGDKYYQKVFTTIQRFIDNQ